MAASSTAAEDFERAEAMAAVNPQTAADMYRAIIAADLGADTDKLQERSILALGELLADMKAAAPLLALIESLRPLFAGWNKARVARLLRTLIGFMTLIPGSEAMQIALVQEQIEWAKATSRKLLVQRLEALLAELLHATGEHARSLSLVSTLLKEVKRVDDKLLLLELHLIESQAHLALRDVPKAKAALTSARTAAGAIFCPPLMQAKIDMQGGILQAEEGDFKTAYSYFYEAFEGYAGLVATHKAIASAATVRGLKYLLLCKVMLNKAEEVNTILNSNKIALKYSGPPVDAMRAVAAAAIARSLAALTTAVATFPDELTADEVIHRHLTALQDTLFERNLMRILEPYRCVELGHIAALIGIDADRVERKLSKMILDKQLKGVMDQSAGTLVLFEDQASDRTFSASMEVMSNMNEAVDALFTKIARLS